MTGFSEPGVISADGAVPVGSRAGSSRCTCCCDATVASLFVDSSVPGAEIEVDDAFVGSTPSSVNVAPGPHTISVKKKGYAAWSRKMNVAGGGIRVVAELEPAK